MALHIVHFIGPIKHNSTCSVRNLCLQALQNGASEIELHISTEGGNMTTGFALYYFLKSLPIPLTTCNIGSVASVGVVIFLAGARRYACPGARFLIHPLHWGFGNLVAADRSRVSEWRECLDFDAERYASIDDEAARGAPDAHDIRPHLVGNARIYTPEQAVRAGLIHEAMQARLPEMGTATHWWN